MLRMQLKIQALQKIYNAGLCYLFSHNIMSPVQNKIHRFGNTPICGLTFHCHVCCGKAIFKCVFRVIFSLCVIITSSQVHTYGC